MYNGMKKAYKSRRENCEPKRSRALSISDIIVIKV
jgi:hypothetical protein